MRINEIALLNFRKYDHLRMAFSPQLNIIHGPNASGKTTILEAIYILSMAKSVRASNDNELIKFNEKGFLVKGETVSNNVKSVLSVSYSEAGKRVKKNDNIFHSLSEFIGNLNVVLFTPSDFLLFKKGPGERRTFIDVLICQLSRDYMSTLNNYRKHLKERNALLKEINQYQNDKKMILLDTLSDQLAKYGELINKYRVKAINEINEMVLQRYRWISNTQNNVRLQYISSYGNNAAIDCYRKNSNEDITRGSTKLGPHVDDIVFLLDEKDAVDFGSQGEQKSLIISLKLTFLELINKVKGEYPVLLLDDVFSELDSNRQNALIKILKQDIQTIITTTSLYDIEKALLAKANLINTEKI